MRRQSTLVCQVCKYLAFPDDALPVALQGYGRGASVELHLRTRGRPAMVHSLEAAQPEIAMASVEKRNLNCNSLAAAGAICGKSIRILARRSTPSARQEARLRPAHGTRRPERSTTIRSTPNLAIQQVPAKTIMWRPTFAASLPLLRQRRCPRFAQRFSGGSQTD